MATTAIPKNKISGGSFLLEERQPPRSLPGGFTEQHQLIGQTTEEFAVNEILPNVEKIEHKEFQVTRDLLRKAGDLGLSGAEIPEAYGGLEMDKVTALSSRPHRQVRRLCDYLGGHSGIGTLPSSISAQKSKRGNICRGSGGRDCWAYALSESTSGSDAMNCAPAPNFRKMASTTS